MFRFRKLKEEESRRKEVLGQAKQSEQSSTESSVLDGAQNSGSTSEDSKDEQVYLTFFNIYRIFWCMVYFISSLFLTVTNIMQESHENGSIVANSNGGLDPSRNERTLNGTSEKACPSFCDFSFFVPFCDQQVKIFVNMLYGFQEAVSKPTSPDATKLTDQENGNDVV
jgi:YidC/Oxa1 family membrane protein insertase